MLVSRLRKECAVNWLEVVARMVKGTIRESYAIADQTQHALASFGRNCAIAGFGAACEQRGRTDGLCDGHEAAVDGEKCPGCGWDGAP